MSLINDALRKANKTQKRRASQGPMGAPVQTVESLKRPASPLAGLVGSVMALALLGVSVWAFAIWWKARNPVAQAAVAPAEAPAQMAAAPEVEPMPPAMESGEAMDEKGRETEPPRIEAAATLPAPNRDAIPDNTPVAPVGIEVPPAMGTPLPAAPVAPAKPEPPAIAAVAPAPPVPAAESRGRKVVAPPATVPFSAPTPKARATGTPGQEGATRDPDFVNLSALPAKSGEVEEFPPLNLQGIFFRLKNPSVLINSRALYVGDQIGGARVVEIQRRTVTLEMNGARRTLSMGGF